MPDVSNDIARDLAMALMRCQNFLPLYIEAGPKLDRAEAADDEAHRALDAYCRAVGTRPIDLWSKHGDKP